MKILTISTHPDDETLGCGGSLLRHRAAGDEIHWLIATATYAPVWSAELIACKTAEIDRVADSYGMNTVTKLGLPTGRLDTLPLEDLIHGIRKVMEVVHPEIVYLVHAGDVHTDHHAVFQASLCVLKPFHMSKWGVRRILSFETQSSTESAPPGMERAFLPTVFQDVSPYLETKLKIMGQFSTEIQPEPLPRSPSAMRALARFRGATIGVEYAEAFVLVREVN